MSWFPRWKHGLDSPPLLVGVGRQTGAGDKVVTIQILDGKAGMLPRMKVWDLLECLECRRAPQYIVSEFLHPIWNFPCAIHLTLVVFGHRSLGEILRNTHADKAVMNHVGFDHSQTSQFVFATWTCLGPDQESKEQVPCRACGFADLFAFDDLIEDHRQVQRTRLLLLRSPNLEACQMASFMHSELFEAANAVLNNVQSKYSEIHRGIAQATSSQRNLLGCISKMRQPEPSPDQLPLLQAGCPQGQMQQQWGPKAWVQSKMQLQSKCFIQNTLQVFCITHFEYLVSKTFWTVPLEQTPWTQGVCSKSLFKISK